MDIYKTILGSFLLLLSSQAMAMGFIAEVGAHFGGDTMATTNNTDGSTDSLRAGEEFSVAAGIVYPLSDKKALLFTFGMKKEVIYPDNGTISFTRYPLDMLYSVRSERWRYGFGLTAHMNPLYKEENDTGKSIVDFKNAYGYLVDIKYVVFEDVFIAGRYTHIEYEVEDDPAGTSYDGSSIGLLVGIQL